MTTQQWESIEQSLHGLSDQDKLEVVEHIVQTVRAATGQTARPVQRQLESLKQLCGTLDVMPTAMISDSLSNRDHDRILYGDRH